MGKFFVLSPDRRLVRTGVCPDGTEEFQAVGDEVVGLGDPPDGVSVGVVPELHEVQARKSSEINIACRAEIIGGFTSSALGAPHVYDSEETDQINLIGQRERATLTGEAQLYKCREVATGIKDWLPHTAAQLNQVFLDGAAFKETQLVQATLLKASIAAATTLDDILAVVWVDPA